MTSIRSLLCAAFAILSFSLSAQTWDFTLTPDGDIANLDTDTGNWNKASDTRWANKNKLSSENLIANGSELEMTKGLKFTAGGSDKVRIDLNNSIRLNGKKLSITTPSLSAGSKVTVVCETANASDARGVTASNLSTVEGFTTSTERQTNIGTVISDGEVTITTTNGMAIYSITVEGNSATPDNPDNPVIPSTPDHSVSMNPQVNQMLLTLTDNSVKYYNTSELETVAFDKTAGEVRVTPKVADWQDKYLKNVSSISFAKTIPTGSEGAITNRGVNITEAKGWLESAYMKWTPYEGASSYNVYIKGGQYSDYTPVDHQLVRDYGSYCRVDVPGLSANVYTLKVVPVIDGSEDSASASEAADMSVKAHDRSGFAFHKGAGSATYDGNGIGAYKENGELKDDARVIYVTAETAKTVTCDVIQDSKGKVQTFTGLQNIIYGYQKGYELRPLCVRLIGLIKDSDLDDMLSSSEGLQIKGKNAYSPIYITVEGIGDDATTSGFGFLIRNCSYVELRNFANMLCMDDCLSFDTDNSHCWVHHMDFFYGNTGGDSDQAKGDGTVDIKGDSQYMTIAYNHFWDCGKTSLCGMKSESGPNYIDYHHNWFDHSDSRHPRVRTMTVHVWNNYYDGVAKYGVGATTGSNVFVEGNFYRHTKDPMMISKQGTDAKGDGTFSGENGGMIKSFGNVYAEKGTSSNYTVITHNAAPADFDCYEASTRDEIVPDTYKTKAGATSYSNFDTDATVMHTYTAIPALEVPATVMGYYGAGRLNKGDFKWQFNNATEDDNYSVIQSLKTALQNYTPTLLKTF